MTVADYNRAFSILVEYQPDAGPEAMRPGHEEMRVFVDPGIVSDGDVERLEELGFHPSPNAEFPHFYVLTS